MQRKGNAGTQCDYVGIPGQDSPDRMLITQAGKCGVDGDSDTML